MLCDGANRIIARARHGGFAGVMSSARARRLASLVFKQRRCPFCGWFGYRFEPFGNAMVRRPDAQCPICGSLERHRAAFLLLRDRIAPGQKVLHVAPEKLMIPWLVSLACEYLNVDLHHPAMRRMDITATELPAASKTLVWCSHVLEHIPDDRKALSELFRILSPGGLLVLQVPIGGDTTFEDPSVTTDEQRMKKFLQEDHVRLYGRDLKQRVTDVGFVCEMLTTADLPEVQQTLYALKTPLYREVFLCHRPL
jgi:predicted SAM-dependent methyltransferase